MGFLKSRNGVSKSMVVNWVEYYCNNVFEEADVLANGEDTGIPFNCFWGNTFSRSMIIHWVDIYVLRSGCVG